MAEKIQNDVPENILQAMKEAIPGLPLYKKRVLAQEYLIRPLTLEDHKSLEEWNRTNPNATTTQFDERIFNMAVLYPKIPIEERANMPCGIYPTISQVVQQQSGIEGVGPYARVLPMGEIVETIQEMEGWGEPTEEDIAKVKAMIPLQPGTNVKWSILKVTVGSLVFLIRGVGRLEFNKIALKPNDDQETEVLGAGLLWPTGVDMERLPAGIPTKVANIIMEQSGFTYDLSVQEV